jgi:thioredoxin 1
MRIFVIFVLLAVPGLYTRSYAAVNTSMTKVKTGAICSKTLPKKSSKSAKKPAAKINAALPKLLDLGASNCIPCKMMVSVLDELSKEYKSKLNVEFIDVWKNQAAGNAYKIQSIPTQIFFNAQGKEFYRHVGYFPKDEIVKVFTSHGIKLTR